MEIISPPDANQHLFVGRVPVENHDAERAVALLEGLPLSYQEQAEAALLRLDIAGAPLSFHGEIWFLRGRTEHQLKHWDRAIECYQMALANSDIRVKQGTTRASRVVYGASPQTLEQPAYPQLSPGGTRKGVLETKFERLRRLSAAGRRGAIQNTRGAYAPLGSGFAGLGLLRTRKANGTLLCCKGGQASCLTRRTGILPASCLLESRPPRFPAGEDI